MKKILILFVLIIAGTCRAANEIQFAYPSANDPNIYCIISRTTDSKIWDAANTAWATWVNKNEPNYALDLTLAHKDFYRVSMPAGITVAGIYPLTIYKWDGVEPNVTNDLQVGTGEIAWSGSVEVTDYTIWQDTNEIPTVTAINNGTAIHNGICQAGSTYNNILLATSASSVNDYYKGCLVTIVGGTGDGQARLIADYVGSTRSAIVDNPWATAPTGTSEYRIYPFSGILLADTGLAAAAAAGTITLAASAPAIADSYIGHTVFISGGIGIGQARLITAYTNTRIATVSPDWTTTPDTTSIYKILPVGRVYVNEISASAIASLTIPTAATIRAEMDSNSAKLARLDANISSRSTLAASDNIGINWSDITNPTATVNLSGTTVKATDVNGVNLAIHGETGSMTAASIWSYGTRTLTALDEDSTMIDLDNTIIRAKDQNGIALATHNEIPTAAQNRDAVFAKTGITAGGTWTFAKILKIFAAWNAGNWQKTSEPNVYEVLDAEDANTVILDVNITGLKKVTVP